MAFGMRSVRHTNGGTPMRVNSYSFASGVDAIYDGAPVKLDASNKVVPALATDALLGVATGVKYRNDKNEYTVDGYFPNGSATFAAVDGEVMVLDADDEGFEIESDGDLQETNIGDLADIVVAAGAAAGTVNDGRSNAQLDQSTAGTTGTQLKIVGVVKSGTNGIALVKIANKQL